MRLSRWSLIAPISGVALLLTSAVFAVQQGTRFPGERLATTSLMLDMDEGDELILTYNTLQFGPQFTAALLSADEAQREQFAGFVPQRLNAKFTSDVDLKIGEETLASGKYGLTFLSNGEGGLMIRFLQEGQSVLQADFTTVQGEEEFKFLNLNLRSAGSDDLVLSMDYGSLRGRLDLSVAPEAEEAEATEEEDR